MTKVEYICIKSFEGNIKYQDLDGKIEEGKIYSLVRSPRFPESYYVLMGSNNGVSLYGSEIHESRLVEYFIPLAEWREKRINEILKDD